ncbi:MBL fold metallo-hydrolase [Spirochaeta cellobiosiphila]|uniref:MBL fold metallo-hydrolase n=1 Tax=Spirochaeta cellobiosiphila TaxID=504483 RepID=UPI0003FF9BF1|nr:MBL fold metallo-hydrolase [Spirochaeta cellobiosiphila]
MIPEEVIFPKEVNIKYTSKEFMEHIERFSVPINKVAMWTLGQNSWILKNEEGTIIAIDPYLTDYCGSKRTGVPTVKSRILPIFIEPEDLKVDIVLITHSHPDHADPYTLERLTIKDSAYFAAPFQAVPILKKAGIKDVKLVHPLEQWEWKGIKITGTFAEPTDFTDLNHMGFVLHFACGKKYYNSGDTAKTELLEHVNSFDIDWMSICINGGYHNLTHWEAAEITALINPKIAIPAHFDMMPHNIQPPTMFRKSLSMKAPNVQYYRLEYYEPSLF